jgi:hypothetical protein
MNKGSPLFRRGAFGTCWRNKEQRWCMYVCTVWISDSMCCGVCNVPSGTSCSEVAAKYYGVRAETERDTPRHRWIPAGRRLLDAAMRAVLVVYWYHQYYSASLITQLRSCTSCWVKDEGSDKILARLQSSISLSATLSMNGCKQARISSDDLIWRKKCDYVGLEVNQDSPRWKKAPSLTVLQSAKLGGAGKVGSMHTIHDPLNRIYVSVHDMTMWAEHTHI